jgi:hypothetical protein
MRQETETTKFYQGATIIKGAARQRNGDVAKAGEDKLGSYGSAFWHFRLACLREQALRANNHTRIPIKSCDDGGVKCRGSNRLALPNAFAICTLRPYTFNL